MNLVRMSTVLLALSMTSNAEAGALNPWGTHVGDGAYGVNPYAYAYSDGTVESTLYGFAGLGEVADVIAGVGWTAAGPDASPTPSLQLLLRGFEGDFGLGLYVGYTPGVASVELGPQINTAVGNDLYALTVNAGWTQTMSQEDNDPGSPWAIIAPEMYLVPGRLSLFCEVNPAMNIAWDTGTSTVDLVLVPGLGAVFDRAGVHSASVGAQLPVYDGTTGVPDLASWSVGAWYAAAFGG